MPSRRAASSSPTAAVQVLVREGCGRRSRSAARRRSRERPRIELVSLAGAARRGLFGEHLGLYRICSSVELFDGIQQLLLISLG